MLDPEDQPPTSPADDLEDFFHNSLNGHLFSDPDGTITRANARIAEWLDTTTDALVGTRLSSHLAVGGRILFETHLAPLLRMQGYFDEIALELLRKDGSRLPVFASAWDRKDAQGNGISLRLTFFKATDRLRYEQNLRDARRIAEISLSDERMASTLREQFIAVLGHDLRNPLTAITTGIHVLGEVSPLNDMGKQLAEVIQRSAARMGELINDVMDFARGRLGGGITLQRRATLLEPVLQQVVEELRIAAGTRAITTEFAFLEPVDCDSVRISQLVSNLLGNALTHGSAESPVVVRGHLEQDHFELSVSNAGKPIPPDTIDRLFEPFTREEVRPSTQGLGLGLYIASQIARAHGGDLQAESTPAETRFTLRIPRAWNAEETGR